MNPLNSILSSQTQTSSLVSPSYSGPLSVPDDRDQKLVEELIKSSPKHILDWLSFAAHIFGGETIRGLEIEDYPLEGSEAVIFFPIIQKIIESHYTEQEAENLGLDKVLRGIKQVLSIFNYIDTLKKTEGSQRKQHKEAEEGDLSEDEIEAQEGIQRKLEKSFADEMIKRIKALAVGESLLIPGGWRGVAGDTSHAMLYELFIESHHRVVLRIFNTGMGISEHDKEISRGKRLFNPIKKLYLKKENILRPEVWQWHFHVKYGTSNIRLNDKTIYNGLIPALDPLPLEQAPPESFKILHKNQYAGTCVADSLLSYIKYILHSHQSSKISAQVQDSLNPLKEVDCKEAASSKKNYSLLKLDLRRVLLKIVDRCLKEDLAEPLTDCFQEESVVRAQKLNLLSYFNERFAANVEKQRRRSVQIEEELKESTQISQGIHEQQHQLCDRMGKRRIPSTSITYTPIFNCQKIDDTNAPSRGFHQTELFCNVEVICPENPDVVGHALQGWVSNLQTYVKSDLRHDESVFDTIQKIVQVLPTVTAEDYWKQVCAKKDNSELFLQSCVDLSEMLILLYWRKNTELEERILLICLAKLFSIAISITEGQPGYTKKKVLPFLFSLPEWFTSAAKGLNYASRMFQTKSIWNAELHNIICFFSDPRFKSLLNPKKDDGIIAEEIFKLTIPSSSLKNVHSRFAKMSKILNDSPGIIQKINRKLEEEYKNDALWILGTALASPKEYLPLTTSGLRMLSRYLNLVASMPRGDDDIELTSLFCNRIKEKGSIPLEIWKTRTVHHGKLILTSSLNFKDFGNFKSHNFHFSSSYLTEFMARDIAHSKHGETLLNTYKNKTSILPEQFEQNLVTGSSDKFHQVIKTLRYFRTNLHLFKESQYFSLLCMFLFYPGGLFEHLKHHPALAETLASFVKESYNYHFQDFRSALFFLSLGDHLRSFSQSYSFGLVKPEIFPTVITEWDRLEKRVNEEQNPKKRQYLKSLLGQALLSYYGRHSSFTGTEDVVRTLTYLIHCSKIERIGNLDQIENEDEESDDEAEENGTNLSEIIAKDYAVQKKEDGEIVTCFSQESIRHGRNLLANYFQQRFHQKPFGVSDLINSAIFNAGEVQTKPQYLWECNDPASTIAVTRSTDLQLDLYTGVLYTQGSRSGHLPYSIRVHKEFVRLFKEGSSLKNITSKGHSCTFEDEKGNCYSAFVAGDKLTIYRRIHGKWFIKHDFIAEGINESLQAKCIVWSTWDPTPASYFIDKTTNCCLYLLSNYAFCRLPQEASEKSLWAVSGENSSPIMKFFRQIDPSALLWIDVQSKIAKIDLLKFELHFDVTHNGPASSAQFHCQEFPGYTLANPSFHPHLLDKNKYLILEKENETGKHRMLLLAKNELRVSKGYYIYNIDDDQELSNQSSFAARFALIRLYLQTHSPDNYERAISLLRTPYLVCKPEGYTSEESNLLLNIVDAERPKSSDIRAVAIILICRYLVHQNDKDWGLWGREAHDKLWPTYCAGEHHLPHHYRLTDSEFAFFYQRHQVTPANNQAKAQLGMYLFQQNEKLSWEKGCDIKPITELSLDVLDRLPAFFKEIDVINNFPHLYAIAFKSGLNKEKEALRFRLHLSQSLWENQLIIPQLMLNALLTVLSANKEEREKWPSEQDVLKMWNDGQSPFEVLLKTKINDLLPQKMSTAREVNWDKRVISSSGPQTAVPIVRGSEHAEMIKEFEKAKKETLPYILNSTYPASLSMSSSPSIINSSIFKPIPRADSREKAAHFPSFLQWLQQMAQTTKSFAEKQFWVNLQKQLVEYAKKPSANKWELDTAQIHNLISKLSSKCFNLKTEQSGLLKEMLDLAHKYPPQDKEEQLNRLAGKFQKRKLSDLLKAFRQGSYEAYTSVNRFLTKAESCKLHALTEKYLLLATWKQQLDRSLKIAKTIRDSGVKDDEELVIELYKELHAERAYEISKYPVYLLLEYHSNLLLRSDQVKKLDELQTVHPKNWSLHELGMGQGKTTILIPLLLGILADGSRLPVLMLPNKLTETFLPALQQQSGEILGQMPERINWKITHSRGFNELAVLQSIESRMKTIIANKNYLVVTEGDMRNLRLLGLQFAYKSTKDPKKTECTEAFDRIFQLLKKVGCAIVDEVDTCFRPDFEEHLALGKQLPINPCQIGITQLLYDVLLEKFSKTIAFDFYPSKIELTSTTELYHEKVRPVLAQRFVELLTQEGLSSGCYDEALVKWMEKLRGFLRNHPSWKKENINEYLLIKAQPLPVDMDDDLKNLLAFVWFQLNSVLPQTLHKRKGERYGRHTRFDDEVIPFHGAGRPLLNAQFSLIAEQLNYTIQGYHGTVIDPGKIQERILEHYLPRAEKEIRLQKIPVTQTEAYQEFSKFFDPLKKYDLLRFNKIETADYAEIAHEIVKDYKRFHAYIAHFLLKSKKVPSEQFSCTSQDLSDMFSMQIGLSGTIHPNQFNFHENFQEKSFESDLQGKIAFHIAKSDVSTLDIQGLSSEEILKHLLSLGDVKNCRAILDAGAFFLGVSMESLASQVLKLRSDLEGVVFYSDDQPMLLRRNQDAIPFTGIEIDSEKRFTIYDQGRCTGTNISQARRAHAIVTVHKEQSWRDVAQAIWRMRGIEKGQSITLCISKEVANMVKAISVKSASESITITDFIGYLGQKHVELQSKNALKTVKQKIQRIVDQTRVQLLELYPHSQRHDPASQELISLSLHKLVDAPYHQYGLPEKEESSNAALQQYAQCSFQFLTQWQEKHTKLMSDSVAAGRIDSLMAKAQDQLRSVIQKTLKEGAIPDSLSSKSIISLGQSVEMEVEQEQEQDQEQEINDIPKTDLEHPLATINWQLSDLFFHLSYFQSGVRTSSDLEAMEKAAGSNSTWTEFWGRRQPLLSVNQSFVHHPLFKGADAVIPFLFSKDLLIDPNLVYLDKVPYDYLQKPRSRLLIIQSGSGIKCILLEWDTAEQVMRFLRTHQSQAQRFLKVCLYDVSIGKDKLGIYQQGPDAISWSELESSQNFCLLMAQAKFLCKEIHGFSAEEMAALNGWLTLLPDAENTLTKLHEALWGKSTLKDFGKKFIAKMKQSASASPPSMPTAPRGDKQEKNDNYQTLDLFSAIGAKQDQSFMDKYCPMDLESTFSWAAPLQRGKVTVSEIADEDFGGDDQRRVKRARVGSGPASFSGGELEPDFPIDFPTVPFEQDPLMPEFNPDRFFS